MSSQPRTLAARIQGQAMLWSRLREHNIFVSASRDGTGAFHRARDIASQASILGNAGVTTEILEALCAQLQRTPPPHACALDLAQAAALVSRQGLKPAAALARARVRYQGTDGVRGRIAADRPGESPLAALTRRGEFTPGLCELLCAAFMQSRRARRGERVVLAEDGRDGKARRMTRAARSGLTRCGARVVDLGVAPTPLVPVAAASLGAPFGAVITASHNPADQNGIKFFVDGRKLLPEPDDCVLSAHAFGLALEGLPKPRGKATVDEFDGTELLLNFLRAALPQGSHPALRQTTVVVDLAHGAFAPYARKLFDGLKVPAVLLNEDRTGENINRDSGVAFLEGKETIAAKDVAGEIAIVGKVRELSRAGTRVFGLALDGDGDRGFVLVHDRNSDEVRIIDGDRAAYLLARAAKKTSRGVFAGTVESDLAVFQAAAVLGLKTVMTPVGDKWLSARPKLAGKLLVGEESSGHMVWPVRLPNKQRQTVVTGNGLLSGLAAIAAISRLKLSAAKAATPFKPGVMKTFYTYFVDRPRFHRGSPVWRQDLKLARTRLAELQKENLLPRGATLKAVSFKDDPDMLYLAVEEKGRQLGALFARNSGTENKTATYARGESRHETGLVALARAVNQNHVRGMKDERLLETQASAKLLEILAGNKRLKLAEARRIAEQAGIRGEARFLALLFALTKEGSLKRSAGVIEALA